MGDGGTNFGVDQGETTVPWETLRDVHIAPYLAALEAGARRFDASLAGLGGCPFAPGATGNIVLEDLVFLPICLIPTLLL